MNNDNQTTTTNTNNEPSNMDKLNGFVTKAKPHVANAIDYAKKNPDTVLLGVIAFLLTDIVD
jgi:hypothetical protein